MADVTHTDIQQTPAGVEAPILTMTPTAADKVRELLTERNLPDHGLRVFVQGGGCSGLSYGMAFEENIYPQDNVVETDGIRLIIDPTSLMYMQGAEIDYVDSLMGGGFAINNPNAISSCGCGHSFRTDDAAASDTGGGCGCGSGGCH
jgi:iron-sulfur cluster assembly accessory protein